MFLRKWRDRQIVQEWRDQALAYLVQEVKKIMPAIDTLKAVTARIESSAQTAGQKLDDNAAQIKDLTAQLASMASSNTSQASEDDIQAVANRLNAVADGLSGHLAPIAEAASAASAAASDTGSSSAPPVQSGVGSGSPSGV